MKDKDGKIIYIGKAKNLRNRVRSYFIKNQNYKTQKLVEKIASVEFVLTDNEGEAFLLESNMIKQYRPIYNIELKDQQRYTYLRVTDEKYPRLVVARRTRDGKFLGRGRIYGPFTAGSSKLLTIGSLRKTFKIRICKTLPKKACLEYHLGNCEAPCEFKEAQDKYQNHVSDLESILKGRDLAVYTKQIESDMHEASKNLHFERAAELRDTLRRLTSLRTTQKMESVSKSNEEYFGIKIVDQAAKIMTFKKQNGVIKDSTKFSFDLIGDNSFSNFLFQYYTIAPIPPFVLVSQMPDNAKLLEHLLTKMAGHHTRILVPRSGKRKELMDLIMKNIEISSALGFEPKLAELKEILNLPMVPKIIECFDISNHGADYAVGAMSRFVDGRPDRSGYRRFKIKTVSGQDDFAMINEIIKRRYFRLENEKSRFPDLILVDGGKGQLNSAISALESLALNIPCISLAKENEEIFVPDKNHPIIISRDRKSLQTLQFARDEAHRFGLGYNEILRLDKLKFS
jgi:excinuclease ABC subunit C